MNVPNTHQKRTVASGKVIFLPEHLFAISTRTKLNNYRQTADRRHRPGLISQDVNVLRPSSVPNAGKALVSGRVQVDRIGNREGCRHGPKGLQSRALPASRNVRLTV